MLCVAGARIIDAPPSPTKSSIAQHASQVSQDLIIRGSEPTFILVVHLVLPLLRSDTVSPTSNLTVSEMDSLHNPI